MNIRTIAAMLTLGVASTAQAENWVLNGDASHLAFGSIKNDYIAEIHSFPGLSGTASKDDVSVTIDLASVQTNIDIRNERMNEHVFGGVLQATLSAQVDLGQFDDLSVGESALTEFDGTLSLLGEEVGVFTDVLVIRLGDDSVMVTTNDMVFLATDTLGIDGGIDMLQEIASLDGIARATPITARFVFSKAN